MALDKYNRARGGEDTTVTTTRALRDESMKSNSRAMYSYGLLWN